MSTSYNNIKKYFFFLAMIAYIGVFAAAGVLLLKMLYFPGTAESSLNEDDISFKLKEYERNEKMIDNMLEHREPMPRGHFHMADKYVLQLESDPPVCLTCHGIYPHNREKKTTSFLNMHVGFMACEICHIRKKANDKSQFFRWADLETGEISMRAEGGFGKYPAKIVLMKIVDGHAERLDKILSEPFSVLYSKYRDLQPPQEDQQDEVKKVHEDTFSKKPVQCLDCHIEDGYLNFSELGFQKKRTNQLISSEVSRMVEHYETFYMPKMLMMNRKRANPSASIDKNTDASFQVLN